MFNSRNANGWSIREEEDCGLEGFDVKSNENLDMEEMKGLTEAELNKVETQVAEALRGAARFEPVDNDMLGDIDSGDVGHLESGDPFNILVGMSKERRAWFEDKIRPIQSISDTSPQPFTPQQHFSSLLPQWLELCGELGLDPLMPERDVATH
ncbi:hypothetical protein BDV98DRAFT_597101 [Pterulicium gracile]|uniref:Uncharacterized protein n=1 Tax=Pterulicium gracile TaxID=1884261 RepID=A0A5C3Q4K8_9AGAR|nr:hypothetical protein BDV98DRAFT_597101 [Pterula gracilis]